MKIARPYGVYADSKKRTFIADPGARSVHVIDPLEGRYLVVVGEGEQSFASPIGIAQDADEMVYVTDSAKGAIYRFALDDLKVQPFVTKGLLRPTGIAYSPGRRLLYVSDTLAGQVVGFDRAGKEVLRFGASGEAAGSFNRPTDLAVGTDGSIVVTDSLNGRMQIFSSTGAYLRGFGERGDVSGTFAKPKGVAIDSKGHLHVCDTLFDTVQVFNKKGELLLSYGTRGSGNGQLWMPSGLFIDANDTIYVADTYNNRIQVFQLLPDHSEE
ncbi:6-bladed beta-propeller [Geomonas paludis]|uniref:6-bladed beta-propeller n=1 Tax=Geomonas paludis TaxID=2740185 RepID=A0ABY4LH32_9BACT|nr:6-bladed beta-propeller [Geomonas paludis]UPU37139.1 6-bladed beta-propeller [Geomonas paludis]